MRSQGGTLEVGDMGGNAELHTTAGSYGRQYHGCMTTLKAAGRLRSSGPVKCKATTSRRYLDRRCVPYQRQERRRQYHQPPRTRTISRSHGTGDIRLDSAGSWVEASTGRATSWCTGARKHRWRPAHGPSSRRRRRDGVLAATHARLNRRDGAAARIPVAADLLGVSCLPGRPQGLIPEQQILHSEHTPNYCQRRRAIRSSCIRRWVRLR